MADASDPMKMCHWRAPSMERPGEDVFVIETDSKAGKFALYEGHPGAMKKLSVDVTFGKAVEKARQVLAGNPAALGDARVLVALAVIIVAALGRDDDLTLVHTGEKAEALL
jgi:hypothetical protein